jgi:hypothetical protein
MRADADTTEVLDAIKSSRPHRQVVIQCEVFRVPREPFCRSKRLTTEAVNACGLMVCHRLSVSVRRARVECCDKPRASLHNRLCPSSDSLHAAAPTRHSLATPSKPRMNRRFRPLPATSQVGAVTTRTGRMRPWRRAARRGRGYPRAAASTRDSGPRGPTGTDPCHDREVFTVTRIPCSKLGSGFAGRNAPMRFVSLEC